MGHWSFTNDLSALLHFIALSFRNRQRTITNMDNSELKGMVTFVNHEKKYFIIEYEQQGKKKTVTGYADDKGQPDGPVREKIKKHRFQPGDTVSFISRISGKGDRMIATRVKYLYNTALDVLVNKARTLNQFTGYLKVVDDAYFVKEIDSYLFFPVPLSPWQLKPSEAELNEAVTFSLENTEKKEKVTAKLFNNRYIPEFYTAVKLHKARTPFDAVVYKISPHGAYLNLAGDKIQAKIPLTKNLPAGLKAGDKLKVVISYLGTNMIIAEPAV
jgi:hypothetical protein